MTYLSDFKQSLKLYEELQLHRRDLFSRINRRLREKINPPVRDILRARRERQQRHRRHRFNGLVLRPRKILSSVLRFR